MFSSLFLISFSCRVFVARFTCFRLPTAMTARIPLSQFFMALLARAETWRNRWD
jgi:hypothetical protein